MEIKFRTWDFKNKKILPGIVWSIVGTEKVWLADPKGVLNSTYGKLPIFTEFTGLKDRNGKEIYEGDIIKATAIGNNFSEELIGDVQYQDFEYIIISNNNKWPAISFAVLTEKEIIGNIFKNPELLK